MECTARPGTFADPREPRALRAWKGQTPTSCRWASAGPPPPLPTAPPRPPPYPGARPAVPARPAGLRPTSRRSRGGERARGRGGPGGRKRRIVRGPRPWAGSSRPRADVKGESSARRAAGRPAVRAAGGSAAPSSADPGIRSGERAPPLRPANPGFESRLAAASRACVSSRANENKPLEAHLREHPRRSLHPARYPSSLLVPLKTEPCAAVPREEKVRGEIRAARGMFYLLKNTHQCSLSNTHLCKRRCP